MSDQGKVLKFLCPVHGLIYAEDVWCRHDTNEATRRVCEAHSAPYGASCLSPLSVELTDATTEAVECTIRHYPGNPAPSVEPGACGDPECHVLHTDPSNPIHPPFYRDSRG